MEGESKFASTKAFLLHDTRHVPRKLTQIRFALSFIRMQLIKKQKTCTVFLSSFNISLLAFYHERLYNFSDWLRYRRTIYSHCEQLGVVGSSLKIVKFFMRQLWLLRDVVLVWPGSILVPRTPVSFGRVVGETSQRHFKTSSTGDENVQVRATMLRQGMRTSSICNTQHVATRRNRRTKRTQHVAPNNVAICCFEMFRFKAGFHQRRSRSRSRKQKR